MCLKDYPLIQILQPTGIESDLVLSALNYTLNLEKKGERQMSC
jgi:hypothetical protein